MSNHNKSQSSNRHVQRFVCFLFLTLSVQFAFAQMTKENEIKAIKAEREASNESIAKHDVEGIAKHWLPDFVQVRGNATHLTGKDTIMAEWKRAFATNPDVLYVRNLSEIIISDNDTLAWETGDWLGFHTYSKGGKYTAMWKKTGSIWMLQAEIFVALYL